MRFHLVHWIALAGWFVGWILLWRLPRLKRGSAGPGPGRATIVIPARNEARRLPALLDALAPGLGEETRVVVVDDHSTDGTAEIARRYARVEVVPAPPLPEGWTGKAWACHTGHLAAAEGSLVFLDADVRCPADGLAPAVALQRERGGLVSVWPYHLRERTYERLNALFAVLSVAGSGAGSLFPPRRPSTALGPVLVTTKEEYRRAGGHESVRADVIEDIALGRRYAGAGLPVTLVGGGDAIAFRMYPDGLIDLVRGWSKSFGRGTALISPLRVVGIAFWVTCAIGSLTWAGGLPRLPSVVLGLLFALQMAVQFRRVGRFDLLDALLYPIHAVFFVGVWVWALFKALVLRRVLWRGRSISVERTPD